MKKIYFFFLLLIMQCLSAQFTENDIKFWVGTGSKKAYFIADFNDNNTPTSYAWGYRFDSNSLTMEDMITAIAAAEPKMEIEIPSGFLYSLNYNHHIPSLDDYWSTWSGTTSEAMSFNNGVNNDPLIDGKWYGVSYGFDPPSKPSTPVPAYSSLWYSASQIINWIGTGNNKSLIVIDFGTDGNIGNANSFVFGIRYNGTISAEQALQQIQTQASYFNFTAANNQVVHLSLNSFTGDNAGTDSWKLYKGKDLSSWQTKSNLSQIQLSNNDWMGLSFGQRRPITPTEAANATLGVASVNKKAFSIYPNPASDFIQISTPEQVKEVNIYSASGQKVITTQAAKVNIHALSSGIYFVEIKTSSQSTIHKIVKK
ncbi:T9SS type A sorting domain-containing protein [Chryseobacterium sp. Mn2064]|uniref:T9SS type A sorting domain-containing protein n=1 Tax=Chryseobacterium sp. Mn2064 TaxID=3395263 RepID=UPI003BDE0AB0